MKYSLSSAPDTQPFSQELLGKKKIIFLLIADACEASHHPVIKGEGGSKRSLGILPLSARAKTPLIIHRMHQRRAQPRHPNQRLGDNSVW